MRRFIAYLAVYFLIGIGAQAAQAAVTPIYWVPATGSCSIPEYKNPVACTEVKGEWIETVPEYCSDSQYTIKSDCEAPYMHWNKSELEEWHCHDGSKHTDNENEYWCVEIWKHQWTYHPNGEGEHCHENNTKHTNNGNRKDCEAWGHAWKKHIGWCEYPDGRDYEWSVDELTCLDSKRGIWYQAVPEHCADGTNKNREQCLAVGVWTGVAAHCTDGVSLDNPSCNVAAQAQVESGAIDTGSYCRVTGGLKRCSELNFSLSPSTPSTPRAYTPASYGKHWPSTSITSGPGNTYCVDNKCTDVPNPSFSIIKEKDHSNGYEKLVTFQVKGKTKDFLYYPVADGLGWDSVSSLQPCECNNKDSDQSCWFDPFATEGTTNPNDCYDEYTAQETPAKIIEVTKYGISKATIYTLPVEAGCPSPLPVGNGLYACASWKFDRLESSPHGKQCSCDSTSTALDCKLVFTGDYTPDASECYDTTRDFNYTQPGYGTRYVRVKKIKRFEIEPFRGTPIATDEMFAVKSRCFGDFAKTVIEERTSEITEYTIPIYNYSRAVSAASRAEPNNSVTCKIKLVSQYGRNVDQNGKGYAGEIFQTTNFIKAPAVDYFVPSTHIAAPGSTAHTVKVYRKDRASVTLSWSVSAAEKVRLFGDDLPGGWKDWYNGKPILQGETTVSNLSYGPHTYRLVAINSRGDSSLASTITIDVIDPPLEVNFGHIQHFKSSGEPEDGVTFWWSVIGAHRIRLECDTWWGYFCSGADEKRGYEVTSDDGGLLEGKIFYKVNPNDTHVAFRAYDRDGNHPKDKDYTIKEESAVLLCKDTQISIYNLATWSSCNAAGEGGGLITAIFCGVVVLAEGWLGGDWQAIEGQCRANPRYQVDFSIPLAKIPFGNVSTSSVGSKTWVVIGPGGVSTGSIGDTSALKDRGWEMPKLPPSINKSGLQWPLPVELPVPDPVKRTTYQDKDPFLPGGSLRPPELPQAQVINKPPQELSTTLSPNLGGTLPILSTLKAAEKDPLTLSALQKGGISPTASAAPAANRGKKSTVSTKGKTKTTGGQKPPAASSAPPKKNTRPAEGINVIDRMLNPAGGSISIQTPYYGDAQVPEGFEIQKSLPPNWKNEVREGIVLGGTYEGISQNQKWEIIEVNEEPNGQYYLFARRHNENGWGWMTARFRPILLKNGKTILIPD